VGYAKALELIITGLPVSGDEALRIGLVNRLVQPENLLNEAQELVTQVGRQGRVAVNLVRQMLRIGSTNAELGMLMEKLASATLYSDEDRSYRMNRFLTKNK
jgi:enoyl-CoA hydratase/carnithine racemase